MMTQKQGFRQGDVLVIPVKAIPATAQEMQQRNGRLIVAEGEATGHHHSFPHRHGAVMFRDDGAGSGMYVRADKPVALEHQEHAALTLAPTVRPLIVWVIAPTWKAPSAPTKFPPVGLVAGRPLAEPLLVGCSQSMSMPSKAG